MIKCKSENSPIVYYKNKNTGDNNEWILFLHAAFVNHNMFRTQIEYFKNKDNVVALDIIGHGESVNTQKGDDIEKMSQWIYDILQNEKISQIHIIGVSLGSVLAQDFANKYPKSVKSLACFGGNAYDAQSYLFGKMVCGR